MGSQLGLLLFFLSKAARIDLHLLDFAATYSYFSVAEAKKCEKVLMTINLDYSGKSRTKFQTRRLKIEILVLLNKRILRKPKEGCKKKLRRRGVDLLCCKYSEKLLTWYGRRLNNTTINNFQRSIISHLWFFSKIFETRTYHHYFNRIANFIINGLHYIRIIV